MRHPEFKSYCFERAEHWRAGCFSNLDALAEGLAVTPGPTFEPISGTGRCDVTTALATDPCGRLFWLRPPSGELVLLQDFGPQVQGSLLDAKDAESLVVGATRLWVLSRGSLLRYATEGLQYLDRIDTQSAASAIASDGGEGLWLLSYAAGETARLQRFDRYGQPAGNPWELGLVLDEASLAVTPDGRYLVILAWPRADKAAQGGPCRIPERWELIVVDTRRRVEGGLSRYDALGALDPDFHPRLVAVDQQSRVHLADPASGAIWVLNRQGELLDQVMGVFPEDLLSLAAISAGERVACATVSGIGYLSASTEPAAQGRERRSVFITPTLISREDRRERGWQRVDVDAMLPEGTSLEISCIATRDASLINKVDGIQGDSTLSAAVKLHRIEERLNWTAEGQSLPGQAPAAGSPKRPTRLKSVVYAGAAAANEERRFRYLLHEVTETHLWLRLVLRTPPGARPPQIRSVRVYYPNLSYLRYLPAVYQEEPHSAAQLRRFLAPFESLFGDLDLTIDRLPAQIDPHTAPPERLPFLLRWFGFPTVVGLGPDAQRKLLLAAPELLANRGTLGALRRLLGIIADVPLEVEDPASGPAPWVLQRVDSGLPMPRLGCDTLIRSKRPYAFRLGRTARLGATPLGDCPVDPKATFAQQAGELRLRFCADRGAQARLEAIVRRFLPYFIPAHCRYRIEFVPPAYWTRNPRLDDDLVLADERGARVGRSAVVGRLRLPVASGEDGIVGRSAVTGGSRLN